MLMLLLIILHCVDCSLTPSLCHIPLALYSAPSPLSLPRHLFLYFSHLSLSPHSRYSCYALSLRETAGGLLRVLTLVTEIMILIKNSPQPVHDSELACILPHLIDKSGHKSERHKAAFQATISIASTIIAPSESCVVLCCDVI